MGGGRAGDDRAAGSTRFSYTQITASLNPELLGALSGSGVVDFAKATPGSPRSTMTSRSARRHPTAPSGALDEHREGDCDRRHHLRSRARFRGSLSPADTACSRSRSCHDRNEGLGLALNASVALDGLPGPNAVAAVHALGPAEVDDVATTQYEVTYAPFHVCTPHQAPVVMQPPSEPCLGRRRRASRPGARHVVLQWSLAEEREAPRCLHRTCPDGPTTSVATLTFSAIGKPVHVVAPPASAIATGGHSLATLFAVGKSCHSSAGRARLAAPRDLGY